MWRGRAEQIKPHLERHVGDVNIVAAPLVEELDLRHLGQDRLGRLLHTIIY
jgi:hypothetical protein